MPRTKGSKSKTPQPAKKAARPARLITVIPEEKDQTGETARSLIAEFAARSAANQAKAVGYIKRLGSLKGPQSFIARFQCGVKFTSAVVSGLKMNEDQRNLTMTSFGVFCNNIKSGRKANAALKAIAEGPTVPAIEEPA